MAIVLITFTMNEQKLSCNLFADAVWTRNEVIINDAMKGLQNQALKHFMDQE